MWDNILNGLGWLLMQIYLLVPDFAAAVIIFSLVTKLILLPFSMKSKKGTLRMQKLQPKTKAIEAKFKDDKNRAQMEIQKLYKEEKVNPLGGCLWSIIPFPILIALYYVIRLPLSHMMGISADDITAISQLSVIADWISANNVSLTDMASNQLPLMNAINANFNAVISEMPHLSSKLINISFNFFGLNLAYVPTLHLNAYMILPLLSALAAYANTVMIQRLQVPATAQQAQQQSSMKMMTYMGPVMSLVFGFMLPSIMSLYWTVSTLFGMAQEYLATLHYRKVLQIPSPAELKEQERQAHEELEALEQARRDRLARLAEEGPRAPKRSGMSNKKYKQLKAQQSAKTKAVDDADDSAHDDESYYDDEHLDEDIVIDDGEQIVDVSIDDDVFIVPEDIDERNEADD